MWRFSDTINRTVDLTPQANEFLNFSVIIEDFSKINRWRQKNFYVETQIGKNHGEEGENSLWF